MDTIGTLTQDTGLEDIAFATFECMFDEFNDHLTTIAAERGPRDEAIATMRGVPYVPVALEEIKNKDFHLGHQPSLILDDEPIENYPCLSVMAYRADPAADDASQDQLTEYRDLLYIETLVKSSPEEGEEICDRRIWRTVDAIHRVMSSNRTLRGTVFDIGTAPTVVVSEVFTRPESEVSDRDWFWQAGRLDYGVNKYSPFA